MKLNQRSRLMELIQCFRHGPTKELTEATG